MMPEAMEAVIDVSIVRQGLNKDAAAQKRPVSG